MEWKMVVGLETGNDLDDEQVRRVCFAIQYLFIYIYLFIIIIKIMMIMMMMI